MLEHRRNGWYVLGGGMVAAGVAWLAAWGVAVASAGPPHPLRFWDAESFVATGVGVAGCLVVLAVMYDWLARLPWLSSWRTGLPLKVVAGNAHFHDWNYAASVVALPIMVTNRTNEPVTLAGGCQTQGNAGDIPSWRERLLEGETGLFLREVESQKRTSHHRPTITEQATIPAHSSLELWYVEDISRDQRGVYLDIAIHFKDTQRNEYMAVFMKDLPKRADSTRPLVP